MESTVTDRIASPEFAVVVRGYDRAQVDEYLGELLAWLSEAERRILATDEANESLRREVVQLRAAAASLEERAGVPGPQSLSAFSERMEEVMQSAVAAAEELRAQAEREANERRDAVAGEVERMIERAKAEAREILRRARAMERDLEENISSLSDRRAVAVEELGRLHRQLSEVLSMPAAAAVGPVAEPSSWPGAELPSSTEHGPASGATALPESPSDDTPPAPEPYDGADQDNVTRALPVVRADAAPTPEPTMVQHPRPAGRGRSGGSR